MEMMEKNKEKNAHIGIRIVLGSSALTANGLCDPATMRMSIVNID